MKHFEKGEKVKWKWGSGYGKGVVQERFTQRVERHIKGSTVVRNATENEPAYLIKQSDGDEVLKSGESLTEA